MKTFDYINKILVLANKQTEQYNGIERPEIDLHKWSQLIIGMEQRPCNGTKDFSTNGIGTNGQSHAIK